MSVERAERFADDLIPATIIRFVLSFALYEFFNHGAEIADGWFGKIEAVVSMLVLPGMLCSALVDGSVHDYSLTQPFPTPADKSVRRGPRYGLGWDIAAPLALVRRLV